MTREHHQPNGPVVRVSRVDRLGKATRRISRGRRTRNRVSQGGSYLLREWEWYPTLLVYRGDMTYEQKWTCMVIIVAICAAISLLLSADRYVVYTDKGYPIIMVDGKEYHPEDMP